jgi:hypothetical protein
LHRGDRLPRAVAWGWCAVAATAAAIGDRPDSNWRSTFSTTTMASSTTNPIANTMPSMLTVLSEKPRTSITASVAIRWPG